MVPVTQFPVLLVALLLAAALVVEGRRVRRGLTVFVGSKSTADAEGSALLQSQQQQADGHQQDLADETNNDVASEATQEMVARILASATEHPAAQSVTLTSPGTSWAVGTGVAVTKVVLGLLFGTLAIAYSATVWFRKVPKTGTIKHYWGALQNKYETHTGAMAKLDKEVKRLATLPATRLVETCIRDRWEEFEAFLKTIQTGAFTAELSEPIRTLVVLWLTVYEQSEHEPPLEDEILAMAFEEAAAESKRSIQISLNKLKTPGEICGEVRQKFLPDKVDFLSSDLESVKHLREDPEKDDLNFSWIRFGCGCGLSKGFEWWNVGLCCLQVRIYSTQQVLQIVAVLFGLGLALLLHLTGWQVVGLYTDLGTLLLIILLAYVGSIHEERYLTHKIHQVDVKTKRARELRQRLEKTEARVEAMLKLWRYQTVPSLKLFSSLQRLIVDRFKEQCLETEIEQLSEIIGVLGEKQDAMDSEDRWIGEDHLPSSLLELVAKDYEQLALFVERAHQDVRQPPLPAILDKLNNPTGWLTVRVKVGDFRALQSRYEDLHPYIVFHQQGESATNRTRALKNTFTPKWSKPSIKLDEDLILRINGQAQKTLVMELKSENSDPSMPDIVIAILEFPLKDEHSKLHTVRQPMYIPGIKKCGAGNIEFDYHLATAVEHWSTLPKQGTPPDLKMVGHLVSNAISATRTSARVAHTASGAPPHLAHASGSNQSVGHLPSKAVGHNLSSAQSGKLTPLAYPSGSQQSVGR